MLIDPISRLISPSSQVSLNEISLPKHTHDHIISDDVLLVTMLLLT